LDPLGQSQVLPYLNRLILAGHSFTVISYEKEQRSPGEILELARRLSQAGVEWVRLPFKPGKFQSIKRIALGVNALRKIGGRFDLDIVHLRGFIPALIFKLALLRLPHLYDFRGFAVEEWADIGKIRPGSFLHQVLRKIDRSVVETACGLVVLENSAESLLRKTYRVPDVPLKVIRTCTDVSLYQPRKDIDTLSSRNSIAFVYLGGARRPYRPDLALRLVTQLLKAGTECRVDFLNESDHAEIISAAKKLGFPQDKMTILKMAQRDVPKALERYDCGLVFLDSSPWRRVCSPTKIGEYFAAGLPVVSIEGIDVLEEFSASTPCVEIIKQKELLEGIGMKTVERITSFIRRPGVGVACQELARRECSLDMAGQLYIELYAFLKARI
jgi:hypothetical protein